ncbi:MAG: 6-phosphogluconolactonase [Halioglobus sp.]
MHSHLQQNLHHYESNAELTTQLARRVASDLGTAIAERGIATLAVSGGSTPKPLFERLSQLPLDWARVTVTQVDERWVDEDHQDSNALLIRQHLLQNLAAAAQFASMKTPGDSPFDAEAAASEKLSAFAQGIDVVVLGMGEDGHTASFFPGAATLAKALQPAGDELCVAVAPPSAPHERMTLSLAALLSARNIYLHITGEAKWGVLQQAATAGSEEELPIRSVLFRAEPPLQIYYANRN